MKITCLRENLKNSLTISERVIGKNLSLPVLSYFLISTEKGMLKITSTDLEIGVDVWVNCKIEKEGGVLVPAKILSSMVNNLVDEKLVLESKDNSLFVKTQNYEANIVGYDTKEFPIIPKIKDGIAVVFDAQTFKNGLMQVVNASAINSNRIEINSVFLNYSRKNLKIVATDTYRLAEKKIENQPLNKDSNPDFSIIIPLRSINELVRILENKEKISLLLDKNQIIFETEGVRLFSRLIDGNFPPYEQVVPKKYETASKVKKQDLLNNLRLVGLFSGKDNRVNFKISENTIELNSQNSGQGENKAVIASENQGSDAQISFNYKYLIDGLNNIQSESVLIQFNTNSATIIKSADRGGDAGEYFYLVMPMKSF